MDADAFMTELVKSGKAVKSVSGRIKGVRTKNGSFLNRVCQTVFFYPNCIPDYDEIKDMAIKAGAGVYCDTPDYVELEFMKD